MGRSRFLALRWFRRQYLPITIWLPQYRRAWLRFDLIAGVVLWGTALPTSMGFAQLAGLPPQAGLYASLVALLAYTVLGTSRRLKIVANSSMAAMSAAIVAPLAMGSISRFIALSAALALTVGIILVLAGLARMGFLADFLAKPVVSGYLFGLALTIAVGMAPRLFGLEAGSGNTVQQLWQLITNLGHLNGWTLAISAGAFGLAILFRRYVPGVPGALVILLLGMVVVALFNLDQRGVAVVGEIPKGLPSLHIPFIRPSDLVVLLAGAGGIVFLALAESLGGARTFAAEQRYEIDPDQELIALGVANLGTGLLQGFTVGANLPATSTASEVRARTQLASVVTAGLIMLTLVGPGYLFRFLPEAVLAVAVIVSVSHLMNIGELQRLYRSRKTDFVLAMTALIGVLAAGILIDLLLAVFLSLAVVLYRASRPHIAVLGKVAGHVAYADVERHPDAAQIPGLLIVRLDASLFFANANMVRSRIKRLVASQAQPVRAVLIDLAASADLDVASVDMLSNLLTELNEASVELLLAHLKGRVRDRLRQTGLLHRIGKDRLYLNVIEGVEAFAQRSALPATPSQPNKQLEEGAEHD